MPVPTGTGAPLLSGSIRGFTESGRGLEPEAQHTTQQHEEREREDPAGKTLKPVRGLADRRVRGGFLACMHFRSET